MTHPGTADTRLLVLSPYLPPHAGGVERTTSWIVESMSERGFSVRTFGHDIAPGTGDGIWPSLGAPIGIPIPRPSIRQWHHLRMELRHADVVLIQNAFWPLSNITGFAAGIERRPAITLVHANAALPTQHEPLALRMVESAHAHTLARWQFRYAPPLAIGPSSQQFIQSHYGLQAGILPLPLPDNLPAIRENHEPSNPLKVVFSARLAPAKAPEHAIRACAIARETIPLTLDIYGDGPLLATTKESAPSWVQFHGGQSWESAIRHVANADVFLSSSRTDNAQLSLLEAIALGVPSVATNVGDATIYMDGVLREALAPPEDPAALAERLIGVAAKYAFFQRATLDQAIILRTRHTSVNSGNLLSRFFHDAISDHRNRISP